MSEPIFVGKATKPQLLLPNMANRHGLIAGATGTGKTVTLRVLAEGFSQRGVPVFLADIKGDLSGLCKVGAPTGPVEERKKTMELTGHTFRSYPAIFWDVFGKKGHPLRTTISEMGPLLLSRLLELNETQSGVLTIAFRVADDQGLLLLDLKDLRAMLQFIAEQSKELSIQYGNISAASVGAIQRSLLKIEEEGADTFFGEPGLNVMDLLQTGSDGRGVINILSADDLLQRPRLYATTLLWLLSEIYEQLPEVGDVAKPKCVLFFDEAHLLFDDAPDVLLQKIEQVVRLVRSKGVGVYFVTQSPLDIPESVLGQLGNRVQHALRAFSPKDRKNIAAVSQNFRSDGSFDVEGAITELKIGEALVSLLDSEGAPTVVTRTLIAPPESFLGPVTEEERKAVMANSLVNGIYDKAVDRDSAYELLKKRKVKGEADEDNSEPSDTNDDTQTPDTPSAKSSKSAGRTRQTPIEGFIMSAVRSIGSQVGRQIMRGVMGSIFKK